MQKLFSKFVSILFFRKLTECQPNFFSNIKKLPQLFLKNFSNFFLSQIFFLQIVFTNIFFYKLFLRKFFLQIFFTKIFIYKFFLGTFFSTNFFYENFYLQIFFRDIFFYKFFLRKFFSSNFFLVKIFLIQFFSGENDSFHKNISVKIFSTIFSRISFVFDVCEIMYFPKFFIRNFAYCEFVRFAILMYGKKNCKFFLRFFFSAMNANTKFENCSFLKKSKIFSDRTFGFLYSLLGKQQCFAMKGAQEKSKTT